MRRSNVSYRRFTDEEIAKADRVDLVRLAEQYGFQTEKGGRNAIHLKNSGGLYIFPNENRFYHHTADDKHKRGGAISFVIHMENIPFGEAVAKLLGEEYITYHTDRKAYTPEPRKPMELPEKARNFDRAYWYLVKVRGIAPDIVSAFMNAKAIFQTAKYGNAAFVGYDRDGTPKYCSMRATYENSSYKRDADNSDKSYPFFYEGRSDLVIVSEAPIINVEAMCKEFEGVSKPTIEKYIQYLADANLINISQQLNIQGKKVLKRKNKIYIADSGIRGSVVLDADIYTKQSELGYALETTVFKHVKDHFTSINKLYEVGYVRDGNGAEIDVAVQYAGRPIQYIEAKMRNNSTIKDDNGIVIYGMEDVPGYVISKNATDFGLSDRKGTQLYRIPAFAFLYLIGKTQKERAIQALDE